MSINREQVEEIINKYNPAIRDDIQDIFDEVNNIIGSCIDCKNVRSDSIGKWCSSISIAGSEYVEDDWYCKDFERANNG